MVKLSKLKVKPRTLLFITVIVVVGILVFYTSNHYLNSYGAVGDRGRDMLRWFSPYVTLTVELDYMTGMRPDQPALDAFQAFVQKYSGKGVSFVLTEIPSQRGPQQGFPCVEVICPPPTYTISDVRDITVKYRDVFPLPGSISVYVLYLDEAYENPDVGGGAWCATCIFVAKKTIDAAGGIDATYLERVTLAHEVAHLWGLMCINYPTSENPRCDGEGHSTYSGSLMYRAPDWRTNDNVRNLVLLPDEVDDLSKLKNGSL